MSLCQKVLGEDHPFFGPKCFFRFKFSLNKPNFIWKSIHQRDNKDKLDSQSQFWVSKIWKFTPSPGRKSAKEGWTFRVHRFSCRFVCIFLAYIYIYEPVTKGRDLKLDTLPQNQTPCKLFSVLPLESGMFQVTISIIKKWFWSKCVLYGIKTGVRSGVDVCNITNNGHSECHNNTEKNHLYAILMLLVHLSSC